MLAAVFRGICVYWLIQERINFRKCLTFRAEQSGGGGNFDEFKLEGLREKEVGTGERLLICYKNKSVNVV